MPCVCRVVRCNPVEHEGTPRATRHTQGLPLRFRCIPSFLPSDPAHARPASTVSLHPIVPPERPGTRKACLYGAALEVVHCCDQRRTAISAHTPSITPNGHVPDSQP